MHFSICVEQDGIISDGRSNNFFYMRITREFFYLSDELRTQEEIQNDYVPRLLNSLMYFPPQKPGTSEVLYDVVLATNTFENQRCVLEFLSQNFHMIVMGKCLVFWE